MAISVILQVRPAKGEHLFIADQFDDKPLTKLNKIMYKSNMLESIFIEICN